MLRSKAEGWKARYQSLHRDIAPVTYHIKATALQTLLQSQDVVCIAFYWITTTSGPDLVPIAINQKGVLVKQQSLITVKGQGLSWEAVKTLRQKYRGTTKALIFGRRTFERLIDQQGAQSILIEPAINDKEEETLVLSNEATPNSELVDDDGVRCPTVCPTDNHNTL